MAFGHSAPDVRKPDAERIHAPVSGPAGGRGRARVAVGHYCDRRKENVGGTSPGRFTGFTDLTAPAGRPAASDWP
jgi:hypothetical protein